MNLSRTVIVAFATASSTRAFSTSSKAFLGRPLTVSRIGKFPSVARTSRAGMTMFFRSLFGGDGGAYALTIDYESLPHPGPELAQAAKAGSVLVTSVENPTLHIATFSGGCFWGLELAYQRV